MLILKELYDEVERVCNVVMDENYINDKSFFELFEIFKKINDPKTYNEMIKASKENPDNVVIRYFLLRAYFIKDDYDKNIVNDLLDKLIEWNEIVDPLWVEGYSKWKEVQGFIKLNEDWIDCYIIDEINETFLKISNETKNKRSNSSYVYQYTIPPFGYSDGLNIVYRSKPVKTYTEFNHKLIDIAIDDFDKTKKKYTIKKIRVGNNIYTQNKDITTSNLNYIPSIKKLDTPFKRLIMFIKRLF